MNGRPFLDTDVLIYAYLKEDLRSAVAQELVAAGGVIGVQQLNEFVSVTRRKLGRSWPEVTNALDDLRLLCPDPRPMSANTHEAGVEIAQTYGYGIYDALVIAVALEASCSVLYSEDMHDGQRIEGVTIRNPFRSG